VLPLLRSGGSDPNGKAQATGHGSVLQVMGVRWLRRALSAFCDEVFRTLNSTNNTSVIIARSHRPYFRKFSLSTPRRTEADRRQTLYKRFISWMLSTTTVWVAGAHAVLLKRIAWRVRPFSMQKVTF
jgi:hypothetical protein